MTAIRGALKVAHIPEDRMTMGIAPKLSLTENMIADKLSWKKFLQKRYAGSTARLSVPMARRW
ncbi:MAG: hypothetical protein ACLSE4_09700 [Clostridium sp.]